MKREPIRILASVLICALYLCATVGFDIHHDHHDEEIYLVSLLRGIDCEIIHPDDECNCCKCPEHCHEHPSDCTDEVEIISLTGTNSGSWLSDVPFVQILLSIIDTPVSDLPESVLRGSRISFRAHPVPPLLLFGVLRV